MAIDQDVLRIAEAMPDYDIERELGRGGMGVVFLGRHRRLNRGAAIKELPASFAVEEEVRERFATEAQTLAGLAHPHIVPIFDYVEREGLCLIVMQELPGGSVWDRFTTDGLTPPTACAIVMACCAALQHAHDKGVLHLDVKPDNLMFDAESAVKVTDFGISRVITGGKTMGTIDGQVLGTPAYMSPEQARGDDLTAASDVYAAGVMLYELLSGQLPWQGAETAGELLEQRLEEDPIPLIEVASNVAQPLNDVVMTSLAREVGDRYARAEDFGVAIGQACAESWGPGWIDHSGVALVGSERLSMAARTTGAHPIAGYADAAPATEQAAVLDLTETRVTGASAVQGADETSARGASSGGSGAPATGARPPTSSSAPATGARPPAAPATGAAPPAAPATGASFPVARSTESSTAATPAGAPETGARPPTAPTTGPTTSAPATQGPEGRGGDTGGPDDPDESTSDAPGGAPNQPLAPIQFEAVRAESAQRIRGADLNELELADLINVEDVLDPPGTPWRPVLLTAVLFAAMVLVALVGIGDPAREGDVLSGQVALSGVDVASGSRVPLDLGDNVVVEVPDDGLAAGADEVELAFSYLGQQVGAASAPLRDGRAVIDPGLLQRTVGGHSTAEIRVLARDDEVASPEVPVDATQTWFLTAPFLLGSLVLLLAYANLETSLRPLRAGHSRRRSTVGAVIWCSVGALGIVAVLASLGFSEPTGTQIVVAMALGAVGGIATVRARIGLARRQRIRKAVKRAESRLGAVVNSPA